MTMIPVEITGKTASTPGPVGPIRKLSITTAATSKATIPERTTKSYQGRVADGIGTKVNGSTMKKQSVKTTRLRMNADQAVHCIEPSTRAAGSHTARAKDTLIHIVRRCARRT